MHLSSILLVISALTLTPKIASASSAFMSSEKNTPSTMSSSGEEDSFSGEVVAVGDNDNHNNNLGEKKKSMRQQSKSLGDTDLPSKSKGRHNDHNEDTSESECDSEGASAKKRSRSYQRSRRHGTLSRREAMRRPRTPPTEFVKVGQTRMPVKNRNFLDQLQGSLDPKRGLLADNALLPEVIFVETPSSRAPEQPSVTQSTTSTNNSGGSFLSWLFGGQKKQN